MCLCNNAITFAYNNVKQNRLLIKFYNLQGQLLEQFQLNGEQGLAKYELDKYGAGVIVVRVTGDGQHLYSEKITVVH